jgi:hypothetical protein
MSRAAGRKVRSTMVQLENRGRASAGALGRTRELLGAVAWSLVLFGPALGCRSVAAAPRRGIEPAPSVQAPPQTAESAGDPAPLPEQNAAAAASSATADAAASQGSVAAPVVSTPSEPPAEPSVAPQEREVRQLLDAFYRDFAAGDWPRVADHFWPGATLVTIRSPSLGAPPTVVVLRIEDYVARQGAGGRAAPLKLEMRTQRIETLGSIGSAVAQYDALDPSGAQSQGWRGADMFSLVLHDGQWRIAALVFEGARFGRP